VPLLTDILCRLAFAVALVTVALFVAVAFLVCHPAGTCFCPRPCCCLLYVVILSEAKNPRICLFRRSEATYHPVPKDLYST
jgi:hypothetical protein